MGKKILLSGQYLTRPYGTGLLQYTLAVREALPSDRTAFLVEAEISGEPRVNACTLLQKRESKGEYFRSWGRNLKTRLGISLHAPAMPVDGGAILPSEREDYLTAAFFSLAGGYHESDWIFHQSGHRPSARLSGGIAPEIEVYHAITPAALRVENIPEVVTVHDLIPLILPSGTFADKNLFMKLIRRVCSDATLIIAVSENTKKALISVADVPAKKIRVVYSCPSLVPYEGVPYDGAPSGDPDLQETVLRSYGLAPRGYILHLANIEPKKNLGRLIDAYLSLETDFPLVVAGRRAWSYENELRRLENNPDRTRKIKLLGYVPGEYREALYKGAAVFAFPSLCEGFGIPVLDAASRGCAILASGIGSLREICGDAAVYVDPFSTASIASGLRKLVADATLRAELGAAARERAGLFTAERHRAGLEEVYREAGETYKGLSRMLFRGKKEIMVSPVPTADSAK